MKKVGFAAAVLSAVAVAFGDGVATLESGLRASILEKVDAVNPVDPATGARKYISFGFISDIHKCKRVAGDDATTNPVTTYWYGSASCLTEAEQSIRLLGAVAEAAGLDAVINGGDFSTAPILGAAHGLTEAEYTNEIWNVKAMFDRHLPSGLPRFTVDGNHERSYSPNMHMSDAAWAYVLTNFNTSAAAARAAGVDVTYHRDLADAKLGDNVTGRYAGNSFHLDFRRLYATGGCNVRILCLNAYDSANGSDFPCRVYDAAKFFDPATGKPLYGEMTPSNTVMGMVAHGSEEKPTGKSEMVRYAAGDLQNGYMNGYSNAKSKVGPWNLTQRGRGFFGLVAAHFHFVNEKNIVNTMDSQVNPDNKVYASAVSVASAYAVNQPSKPKAHELGTEGAYHFSIFVVDTDKNLLREVRIGGWTSNPIVHEDPVVQLHDHNIRTQFGQTPVEPEPEDPEEPEEPEEPTDAGGELSHYKWAVIGDSLSDPTLKDKESGALKYYHYLQRDTGIKVVYTNGVGSTGYKAGADKGKCFCQRLEANPIPSDVDVVTIHGSVNDGNLADTAEHAGTPSDRLPETDTLAAYINEAIDLVRARAPNARLVLIGGPYYSNGHPDRHVRAIETVRAVAAARGVAFHDWLTEDPNDPLDFHQIEIDKTNETCFAARYAYDWESRGKLNESFGHPNPLYHEIWMAPHFGEVLTVALKPTLGGVIVTPAETNAVISGTVSTLGTTDATACDVYLAVGERAAVKIATGLGLSDPFVYEIPNLKSGTTYHYALSVSNNAAFAAGTSTTGTFITKKDAKPVGELGNFAKKVVFTVGYAGAESLDGMPVLVKLTADSPQGFRYSDCDTDGGDIRFADADGNAIPHEIDTWDPSGESLVWVRIPSVAQGATFTMYYSGTPIVVNNPKAVWSDYTGVWHLNDLGADTAQHSTGLYLNATATTGIDAHLSAKSIADEAGLFGKAFRTNDSTGWNAGNFNEGGAWVADAGAGSPLDADGVFTISGWFKHNTWHYNYDALFYKRVKSDNSDNGGAFAAQLARNNYENIVQAYGSSNSRVRDTENPGPNLMGSWVYLTFVYNGTTCSIYENGALNSSGKIAKATDNDQPLVFGNNANVASGLTGGCAWNGWIDEVRFSKGAKSADWVAAEYAAMASDTFVSVSAATDVGKEPTPPVVTPEPPVLGAVTVTPAITNATLVGAIASVGNNGATACDVYLALGGAAVKIAEGATSTFEYEMTGLTAATTYSYALSISNNAATVMGAATGGSFTTEAAPVPPGPGPGPGPSPKPGKGSKRVTYTVAYDGADSIGGIPVLVKLSAGSPIGFRYSDCAADGGDIRFADADGEAIPHEIDTWNAAGESLVWVKAPAVTKGTVFTMSYGGTPAAANDPKAVWTEYSGVWHLNDLGTDTTEHSQGLYANATATAGIDAHLSTKSIPNETGKFGKAFRTNDSTGRQTGNWNEGGAWVVDAGTDSPIDSNGGKLTVSCWVKHNDWKNSYGEKIIYKRLNSDNSGSPADAFAVEAQTKNYDFAFTAKASNDQRARDETTGKDPDPRSDWVYVTAVYDSSNTILLYVNADHRGGKNYIWHVTDNDAPLVFGNNVSIASGAAGSNAWNGWIDEVRYLKGAKSAAWVAAEYAAMASDAFLTAGEVEEVGDGFIFTVR